MFKILKIGLSFLFLLAFASSVRAATPLDVVINEIAWMGTEANSSDEWIELYNNTNEDINLEGWGLYEDGGEILIEPLTGTIEAESYYLIERTDNNAVPDIEASQPPTSWGGRGLNNSGEYLQLLDNNSQIIDEVNCSDGWLAGDNETKQTMERTDSGDWQTSQDIGGTPKAENSKQKTKNNEQETEPMETGSPQVEAVIYPTGIVFSEILPSPEGPDAENEWIELFNQNNFEVDLSSWQITDSVGKTKVYTFSQGTIIKAQGFLVLNRPLTKITLNNSEDNLILLQPNRNIIDKINYKKAPRGKSFNRADSGWFWSSALTPGASNVIPSSLPSEQSQEKTEARPLQVETSSDSQTKKGIAAISEQFSEPSSPSFILLIALIIAFLSGIVVLFLRKFTTSSSNFPEQNEEQVDFK